MRRKTILITGAGGYVGSEMVTFFLASGYKVKALDRFFFGESVLQQHADNPDLESFKEDIRYCAGEIFKGVDVVIDLAGLSNDPSAELDPRLTEEINQKGPIRIASLAKDAGVKRYLFSSSCSVYGHGENVVLTEESPLAPVSLYAKAKIEAEKGLLKLSDDSFTVTILRNATCFGLSSRMRFDLVVNVMTLHAHKNGTIVVTEGGEQWRPFLHIYDVARAYHMVAEAEPKHIQKQIFNVGGNKHNYQIKQIAQLVKTHFPEVSIEYASGDPDHRDYNVSFDKISQTLGFQPVKGIQDGVLEIKLALEEDRVSDTLNAYTVKHYKYLIDADMLLNQVKYKGKLF